MFINWLACTEVQLMSRSFRLAVFLLKLYRLVATRSALCAPVPMWYYFIKGIVKQIHSIAIGQQTLIAQFRRLDLEIFSDLKRHSCHMC